MTERTLHDSPLGRPLALRLGLGALLAPDLPRQAAPQASESIVSDQIESLARSAFVLDDTVVRRQEITPRASSPPRIEPNPHHPVGAPESTASAELLPQHPRFRPVGNSSELPLRMIPGVAGPR